MPNDLLVIAVTGAAFNRYPENPLAIGQSGSQLLRRDSVIVDAENSELLNRSQQSPQRIVLPEHNGVVIDFLRFELANVLGKM